jgi:hypothetical protein
MRRSFTGPLQIGFVILILASCVGLLFLQAPPQRTVAQDARARCEANGDWWDDQDKVCAVPVPLATITGRPSGASR